MSFIYYFIGLVFLSSKVLSQDDPVRNPVLWDTVLKRHVYTNQSLQGVSLNTVSSII